MVIYKEKEGRLTFKVRVVPRASRSEIAGEHDGALRVRIAAAPVDGAANEELVTLLARALKVPRNAIVVIGGQTSRVKSIAVSGIAADTLLKLERANK
jgi:uncharacterized protein (TIGR00251 family)